MVDFEDSLQGNVFFHDDSTAQFRLLWTIKKYEKVKQSIRHPNCISMKFPVNILPGKFSCGLQLFPNGSAKVIKCDFASVLIYNTQKLVNAWVSYKLSLLDEAANEKYAVSSECPRPFHTTITEGAWSIPRMFPTNISEAEAIMLFPNGCLQILMEGMVWAKEPADKTAVISRFKNWNIMSGVTLNQTEKYSDVTLSVGKGQFQVHKNVLSSKSSVFQEMFEKSSQNIIVIPDTIREEVFREVLNFVYTNTVTAKIETMLSDVLIAARKYKLNYLAEICQVKMVKTLSVNNCLKNLEVSDSCGASQLKEGTLEYIVQNRKLVFATDGWKAFQSKSNGLHWELLERCMNLD